MPFTAQEVENVANAMLEYHFDTPNVRSQTLQDKPLLKAMRAAAKTFPGGKDNITGRVKGEYTTTIQGFEHDDTVTYANPANIKKWTVPWKLIHSGITFTKHEMIEGGISILDSTTGEGESRKSRSERMRLADLLKDKIEDMAEGFDRGMNEMFWRDGSQDSKQSPGVQSFILDDPTTATIVAGIDQSSNTWWRNRADVSITLGDTTGDSQAVVNTLRVEYRQLRRFGGNPTLWLAGSDFLDRMELELKAKGNYTDSGWAQSGRIDMSVADLAWKGHAIQYDPTLDDLGLAKRMYVIDPRRLFPKVVEGENMQKHMPARPENKYTFYRAVTWVGGMICDQRNAHGVYGFS